FSSPSNVPDMTPDLGTAGIVARMSDSDIRGLFPHIATLMRASVTGLDKSIPFAPSTRRGLASVRGRREGRHLMGFAEDRSANLRMRALVAHPAWRPDLIHRPGEGTSLREGWCRDPPENRYVLPVYAAAMSAARLAVGLKAVRSTSMRCMITASLRARATFAFCMPARLAIRIAQLLSSVHPFTGLVRITCAA